MGSSSSPPPPVAAPQVDQALIDQQAQDYARRRKGRAATVLAAQGEGCGAIARRVGISKAAASLLMNGKYKFAAEQAVRPRLAEDVPMLHARTGKPAKVTADTGRQVLALGRDRQPARHSLALALRRPQW